jgi:hypothetical protein
MRGWLRVDAAAPRTSDRLERWVTRGVAYAKVAAREVQDSLMFPRDRPVLLSVGSPSGFAMFTARAPCQHRGSAVHGRGPRCEHRGLREMSGGLHGYPGRPTPRKADLPGYPSVWMATQANHHRHMSDSWRRWLSGGGWAAPVHGQDGSPADIACPNRCTEARGSRDGRTRATQSPGPAQ